MAAMRPLSKEQYAKEQGRRNMAALPFIEKVKCVIELQRRLQPIYARRGITIKPWKFRDLTFTPPFAILFAQSFHRGLAAHHHQEN